MQFKDLLDLTLKEVLETYCVVCNPECGYYYGIFKTKDVEQIYSEFNIDEDYPEAFCPECLINENVFVSATDEIREYDVLLRIMDNLGISKKKLKQK
jgi:hypothetical protein